MERYRHKKRGTEYTVIALGTFSAHGRPVVDDSAVVVIRDLDGRVSVRPEVDVDEQHIASGVIVGLATLQASHWLEADGAEVVVYKGDDGQVWVRAYAEFHDGRFELVEVARP